MHLKYLENGVPYCDEFQFVSISHSINIAIVAISNQPIGIDIQYKNNRVNQLQQKFVNNNDIFLTHETQNINLNLIWCYKESVYKALNGIKCSIKNDITINLKEKVGILCVENKIEKFRLEHMLFKNYFITIAKSNL